MGKKGGGAGGGKKGGGSSSQAKSTPKCVCDHPFQCSCGNRPERPSKGHRWDPETQKWGGKGHKQKGASGQTASVGVEAKTTTVGKTLIAQWQKLPSDILREWCQKQKRPQPKFKELLDDTAKAEFKTRVILNDPKNPDKDLFFTPKESVNNEEQALEEAALLALLNLTPTLPHERKLPEPYRTTWLNAIHAINESKNKSSNNKMRAKTVTKIEQTNKGITQPSVGNGSSGKSAGGGGAATSSSTLALATSFTSAAERRRNAEMNRQERNARIRKHEAVRMANRDHPVFLSARLRSQIQSFLRGDHESLSVNSRDPTEDDGDDDDATLDIFESDLQCYVEERLNHEGFTKRQARKAFSTKKVLNWANLDENEWEHVYEECLQWLCVHLDEDELPEGFDPRGSTLEVVAPSKMRADIAESKEKNGPESYVYNNVFPTTAVVAAKYGITVKDALWMQHCQKDDPSKTLETIFWDRICQLAHATLNDAVVDNIASCNISLVEEEFEAIKAIFPDESTTTTNKESGTSTVCIKTLEGIEVVFSLSNIYPLIFPTNVLFTGNWPLPVGVAFHVEIVKFISTLPLGEPMMFEIFSHGQTLLQTMDELPKISLSSNDSIIKKNGDTLAGTISFKNFDTSDKEADVPKPQTDIQPIKRRPRSRGVFWSQSPDKTKPAVAFSWSRSIEIQRKSLPAWKARDDFLSILKAASKSSRVVLVTGDTGCGKVRASF
jgi:ATP-dependent RNA helicase DHX57